MFKRTLMRQGWLNTLHKTNDEQLLATEDGLYEVLGRDLSCTGAAARAAGAGPVWSWRPAQAGTGMGYGRDEHAFTAKKACIEDLEKERARRSTAQQGPPAGSAIIACPCGVRNKIDIAGVYLVGRNEYSKRFRCGSCHREFGAAEIASAIMSILGW